MGALGETPEGQLRHIMKMSSALICRVKRLIFCFGETSKGKFGSLWTKIDIETLYGKLGEFEFLDENGGGVGISGISQFKGERLFWVGNKKRSEEV